MSEEIACTLSPADMARRGEELREIARAALVERARHAGGVRLVFDGSEAIEAALRDLIRREQECCAFLDFRLDSQEERLTLDIAGPNEAQGVLDGIFDSTAGAVGDTPRTEADHGRRIRNASSWRR